MSSVFSKAGDILASIAPTLATMIGGPFAGQAVAALEKVLGLEPTGDKDAALTALVNATPEQLLALKAEDNRHAEAMEKLGLDREGIAAQDRDSARRRQSAMNDWTPTIIGSLVLLAAFAGEGGLLIYGNPPHLDAVILGRILGFLDTSAALVLAYFFGTNAASNRKTELLSQAQPVK